VWTLWIWLSCVDTVDLTILCGHWIWLFVLYRCLFFITNIDREKIYCENMQIVGLQTQWFTVVTDASVCVCVCVCVCACACACMCACICMCGKEGLFSLFIEFNTCYVDCGLNLCVYQQNPQQFDLVVMQWENNTTGSHSNWSSLNTNTKLTVSLEMDDGSQKLLDVIE